MYAAIPYVHRTTHRLKIVASRYEGEVAISAPNTLGRVCALVDRRKKGKEAGKYDKCSVNHKNESVPCCVSAVYQILLSCGQAYFGEMG